MALLEADVHYKVAKDFVASIASRAVGLEVMQSLTPGQQVIKIVQRGADRANGRRSRTPRLTGRPAAMMLVGLQGSGKTTTTQNSPVNSPGWPKALPCSRRRVPPGGDRPVDYARGPVEAPGLSVVLPDKPEQIAKGAINYARCRRTATQ